VNLTLKTDDPVHFNFSSWRGIKFLKFALNNKNGGAVSPVEKYRRWFDYEKDSHGKVLQSFYSIPEDARSSEGMQRAVDLMAHVVAARMMWLFRFGVIAEKAELFPRNASLTELPSLIAGMETAREKFLAYLPETELVRVFEYQSYEGPLFRNSIEDILTQLFGYSWYHRGQVASLVRSLGGQPAVTDFVFWTREPVAAAEANQ
jgi:uncharacterized damage-inducible protein DinB